MLIIFYILTFVILISALMVVLSKNPVNSVIHLIITFLAIAGYYILLNAQFLAVVHVIVYTGAIMVLFLFLLMLFNLNRQNEPHKRLYFKIIALVSGGIFLLTILSVFLKYNVYSLNSVNAETGLIQVLGKELFSNFLFPFEVSSLIFLSSMVGAVILGKKK